MEVKRRDDEVSVTLNIPRTLLRKLEKEAEISGRLSRSAMIRLLLLRALAANEKTA